MDSRFAEQNVEMLHLLRIHAGTAMKKNADGKLIACADDDPDRVGVTIHTTTTVMYPPALPERH